MHLNKKKKGLFLTVEVLSVIIIITGLTAAAIAGVVNLMQTYKVYQISSEYAEYSKAMLGFKSVYGFYPGDVPYDQLSGVLGSATLKSNAMMVMNSINTSTYGDLFTYGGTNHIDGRKSQLSFAQMVKAGFLSKDVNVDYSLQSQCGNLSVNGAYVLPKSSISNQVTWVIGIDSDSALIQNNNSPRNSDIYSPLVYPKFVEKPRLILFKYNQLSGCQADVLSGIGAVSSVVAYRFDEKVDDGVPVSRGGIVNIDGLLQGKCRKLRSGGVAPLDYEYTDSRDDSSTNGCVVTAIVGA